MNFTARALFLLLASCPILLGQSTPVVARQRVVVDSVDSHGNLLRHMETLATYLQDSSGSTLVRYDLPEPGMLEPSGGTLFDYEQHELYQLNYEKRQATEMGFLPDRSLGSSAITSLGQETLNGRLCTVRPIYQVVDGGKRQIGKRWDLADNGLSIKEDATFETAEGARVHRVMELFDISFTEPDANEFRVVRNFTVRPGPPAPQFVPPSSPK